MKRNKFILNTLILTISGLINKILGLVIRIFTSRYLGDEGIGLYMMIVPTVILFITVAQHGLPIAISKIVAEEKKRSKDIILNLIPTTLLLNIALIIFILLSSNFIANNLLYDSRTYLSLSAISLFIPFVCISSIFKGYYHGKERMMIPAIANLFEQITRIIITIILIPLLLKTSIELAAMGIMIIMTSGEIAAIVVYLIFLPKSFKASFKDFNYDFSEVKSIYSISIPATGSRLIGSFVFFLEPIILTAGLTYSGFTHDFIIEQYGALNGYAIPILTMPSFLSMSISSALIPALSKAKSNNNTKKMRKLIFSSIGMSLFIGIIFTGLILLNVEWMLEFLYKTNKGVEYVYLLAPVFILFYIQAPLTSALQTIGLATEGMKATFIGGILKTCILALLTFYTDLGFYSILIAIAVNIIFVTLAHIKTLFTKGNFGC